MYTVIMTFLSAMSIIIISEVLLNMCYILNNCSS